MQQRTTGQLHCSKCSDWVEQILVYTHSGMTWPGLPQGCGLFSPSIAAPTSQGCHALGGLGHFPGPHIREAVGHLIVAVIPVVIPSAAATATATAAATAATASSALAAEAATSAAAPATAHAQRQHATPTAPVVVQTCIALLPLASKGACSNCGRSRLWRCSVQRSLSLQLARLSFNKVRVTCRVQQAVPRNSLSERKPPASSQTYQG